MGVDPLQMASAAVGGLSGAIESLTVGMSHHCTVLIDNVKYHCGDWSRAAGLSWSWQQIEHRDGEPGNSAEFFPGTTKYEPITLSRAAGPYSRVVQFWLSQTSRAPQPQSGTIQLVN